MKTWKKCLATAILIFAAAFALFGQGMGGGSASGGGESSLPPVYVGSDGVNVTQSGNTVTISGSGAVATAIEIFAHSNNTFYGQNTFTNQLTVDGPLIGLGAAGLTNNCLQLTSPQVSQATQIIYVDHSRSGYTPDGTILQPYPTIQAAIDAVAALGPAAYYTIDIADGVYTENIVLENAGLKYVKLQGHGYVSINPSSGNALQSAANNDNLVALHVDNLIFAKPVVLTGANGASSFADVLLANVSFTGTATLTATCLNNLSMRNVYSEQAISYTNVAWSYLESGQLQGTFSCTQDSALDTPSGGAAGTVLANGIFLSGTCSYTIGGSGTLTLAPNGCRWGNGAVTVPSGVTIYAYNSYIRGTQTNNGAIVLRNSTMEGYVAGTGTLTTTAQPASQYANDSVVSGTTVKDALDTLNGITNTVDFPVIGLALTNITSTGGSVTFTPNGHSWNLETVGGGGGAATNIVNNWTAQQNFYETAQCSKYLVVTNGGNLYNDFAYGRMMVGHASAWYESVPTSDNYVLTGASATGSSLILDGRASIRFIASSVYVGSGAATFGGLAAPNFYANGNFYLGNASYSPSKISFVQSVAGTLNFNDTGLAQFACQTNVLAGSTATTNLLSAGVFPTYPDGLPDDSVWSMVPTATNSFNFIRRAIITPVSSFSGTFRVDVQHHQ